MGSDNTGERIAKLETKVENLHEWAGDLKDAIEKSAASNTDAIKKLTAVVTELAGMRSDHDRHGNELSQLRRRQNDMGNEFGRVSVLESQMSDARSSIMVLNSFKDTVMKALPNLELSSGWVFKAILWVMAALAAVAIAVILKGA